MSLRQTEEIQRLGDTPTCLDATPTCFQEDCLVNLLVKNKKK